MTALSTPASNDSPFWRSDRFLMNLKGIFWKLLACAGFAGVNSFVRYLTGGAGGIDTPLPVGVVVFFQNIFGFLFMLPFVLKDGVQNFSKTNLGLHGIRVIAAVIGIIALYSAFAQMPMAPAVALQFTGPVFTVLGAKLYLNERIGGMRIWGILFGITGAFIITRPDQKLLGTDWNMADLAIFLPLISTAMFAISKLCGRSLALKGERPEILALYLLFFMVPVSGLYAMSDFQLPTSHQLMFLAGLGLCGCIAHYSMAQSYVMAEIIFLMPFGFSRLIFTGVLGYLLFGELPKGENLWIGFAFVVAGVITMTLAEAHLAAKKKAAQAKQDPEASKQDKLAA